MSNQLYIRRPIKTTGVREIHFDGGEDNVGVILYHKPGQYWWIKIKHYHSDPKIGELNFSADRAMILAEILKAIAKEVR